jgi:uncharacterized protein (TIGR02598 family)
MKTTTPFNCFLPWVVFRRRCSLQVCSRAGFSLVEVTLALGIVAVGLVSSLGLLGTGLTCFHQSINTTIQAQVIQQVVGDIRQTDFSQLPATGQTLYFDAEGVELPTATTPGIVYTVVVTTSKTTNLPAGSSTTNLATIKLTITNVSNPLNPFYFSTLISKNDGSPPSG